MISFNNKIKNRAKKINSYLCVGIDVDPGLVKSNKFDDLYKVNENEIPTDLQVMINNNEKGAALMRIVEVIGQDKLERIDEDTIYFYVCAFDRASLCL